MATGSSRAPVAVACLGLVVLGAAGLWWTARWSGSVPNRVSGLSIEAGLRMARVGFHTDRPALPRVDVAPPDDRIKIPEARGPAHDHTLKISGLVPGREYVLRVAIDGGPEVRCPFRTQEFLVTDLEKEPAMDRLRLSWRTSHPARSSILWGAPLQETEQMDVVETPTTTHVAEITGLSPDRSYTIRIVSHLESGEVETSWPISHDSLRARIDRVVREFDRLQVQQRILDILSRLRREKVAGAGLERLLGPHLKSLRLAVGTIKPISREFFSSPDVFLAAKVQVYETLKSVEHLDRLAQVLRLPMRPLLIGLDWGPFIQSKQPFFGGATKPRGMTTTGTFDPTRSVTLVEWRPREEERDAWLFMGRGQKQHELDYAFPVDRPQAIKKAQFKVGWSDAGPLQYLELTVNDRARLVLRPPAVSPPRWTPEIEHVGFDPQLLVQGKNRVRARLLPVLNLMEQKLARVVYVLLETAP
ncbi:MAG: fibronectin type III domain-containing protein [Candidatus Riflebacteria bacterium]|nr:fibronectin type III domain-containing protein [Candidatus Riflebacteria bacterium]